MGPREWCATALFPISTYHARSRDSVAQQYACSWEEGRQKSRCLRNRKPANDGKVRSREGSSFFSASYATSLASMEVANPERCRAGARALIMLPRTRHGAKYDFARVARAAGRRAHCIPPGTGSYWPSPRIRGRLASARRIGQDRPDLNRVPGRQVALNSPSGACPRFRSSAPRWCIC